MPRNLKIGFLGGSYLGMNNYQKMEVDASIKYLKRNFIITGVYHSGCIGADLEFHEMILNNSLVVDIYIHQTSNAARQAAMTDNENINLIYMPEAPTRLKNRTIIDNVEILIVAPKETYEVRTSGLWGAVRYARKINRTMWIIHPNLWLQYLGESLHA